MPSRRGSGYGLARASDTGLARWLAAAQPWEHGIAQTERGASLRGTVTVLGAVAPHRPIFAVRNRLTFFTVSLAVFKDCGGFV
jgi:hypothetical protein